MATPVACSWAYAAQEKVTRAFAQEQQAQKAQERQKSKKGTTDRASNQLMDQHGGLQSRST